VKKIVFRCWALFDGEKEWKQLEEIARIKLRDKPKWMPRWLWMFFINRLFLLEATIDAKTGYIDNESITVGDE
jgi:hypothetical protein